MPLAPGTSLGSYSVTAKIGVLRRCSGREVGPAFVRTVEWGELPAYAKATARSRCSSPRPGAASGDGRRGPTEANQETRRLIGKTLAPYRVEEKIGERGMGQVYRATDTKLGRQVALKILHEAFAADPDRLARFQREAQVLARLNHPDIEATDGPEGVHPCSSRLSSLRP